MALSSTTETKTYILEKYSRSYSSKDSGGKSEWQHFANPVLRLVLDTRQSVEKLEFLRMRVVWTMNGGSVSSADQQNIILEDIDLLAFSSMNRNQSESAHLKGVYRDTTFGLRYLHGPLDSPDSEKVYHRFQVSFSTTSEALQLVDAIRDVCPCKSTDATAQMRKKTMVPRAPAIPQQSWELPSASAIPTSMQSQQCMPAAAKIPDSVPVIRRDPFADPASIISTSMRWQQRMPNGAKIPEAFTEPASTTNNNINTQLHYMPTLPNQISSFNSPSLLLSSQAKPGALSSPAPSPFQLSSQPAPLSSSAMQPDPNVLLSKPTDLLPDSSPPDPSCSMDTAMPPPPLPLSSSASSALNANTNVPVENIDMAEALREATGLYDLSHAALERLVGDVVREDRFGVLLERMSSMWAAKAAVGTHT